MPCRFATAATGSRSASRMIATICSSVNRPFRIAPSESGASLSTNRRSEHPEAGQDEPALALSIFRRLQLFGDPRDLDRLGCRVKAIAFATLDPAEISANPRY